mmetsp:Transcript_27288/g.69472  ORF Transcript_27288/g.69472 Transcript_27288/m.69472 type:complete len:137 (-) Transcript_27288:327-737(-)|eukprot:CAMPEP_0202867994 /NCGR_PEP_ID=MMETSP1391-20130828/9953_1 /ASSEMBLY_ACC=CAM_ASM_000867 /TAXON_ID=1034604 /ORGANISM="Chlamydomonas leiostraca, Strain SAG 11-49" /LENGTH=136 /DNA_ID=CAMNT_0049548087 /DNA_START=36 /DNA_END=446 /DNA_ORIENTATION=-
MPLPVTAGTAGYLGTLLAGLATPIGLYRLFNGISHGVPADGKHDMFERLVRAHGNATEYVPIFLILLAACEDTKALPQSRLAMIGTTYCVLRTLHSANILRPDVVPKICRMAGFVGGIAAIAGLSGVLLLKASQRA